MANKKRSPYSDLAARVGTGIVGGGLLLAVLIYGGWIGALFLTAVLSLGMLHEFATITFELSDGAEKRYVLLGVAWLVIFAHLVAPQAEHEIFILSFLGIFTYYLFSAERHVGDEGDGLRTHFQDLVASVFSLVYLVFLPLYLPQIRISPNGVHWTLIFFFIVFAGDTGAYFVGKKYGRTRLYPAISPKKSVEGALGGLASGYLVTFVYKIAVFRALPWFAVATMPLLVGVVAQIGDLCESFIKRAFNKKDAGAILPGHGGFMDRFDGIVLSLPVMYACVRIFA